MPRATAAAAALTADRILEAATELFANRGFAEVSLDDVARAAEVTRGAVYHHYRSKTGLFEAVVERLQSEVADAVVAAAERAGDSPEDQLCAGSHAFLDAITSGSAARTLLIDAPVVVGWQEWRRLDVEHSAAHLRDALRDVGISSDQLKATTALLSGAMNETALWIMQQEDAGSARAQAHRALDGLLGAYVSVASASS